MPSIHRIIWNKFSIHRDEDLPFMAWQGTRNVLAELFAELGYKTGAEVGVQGGYFSEVLCKGNPGLKLKSVDPWTAYHAVSQEKQNHLYSLAVEKLSPYNVEIIKMTSMEAALIVPDNSLDFVYIDGLHDFDAVMMDLICWSKKVRSGGIVSGHDYTPGHRMGVIPATHYYVAAHGISPWYLTMAGAERRDTPSFFWVKP